MLALWLFLPVAAAIGTLYFDRIALAVERRFYPWLPPAEGASIVAQTWDGIAVALKVLALNIVALILSVLFPGVGFIIGWAISAYAIGRGLFVAVAMRRMPRAMAEFAVPLAPRHGPRQRRDIGRRGLCPGDQSPDPNHWHRVYGARPRPRAFIG